MIFIIIMTMIMINVSQYEIHTIYEICTHQLELETKRQCRLPRVCSTCFAQHARHIRKC